MGALQLLIGYLADWIFGEPENPAHPVRLMAKLANGVERLARRRCGGHLRLAGGVTWLVTAGVTLALSAGILRIAGLFWPAALLLGGGMVYFCISPKGLCQAAHRVTKKLEERDIDGARHQLSMIVGRDTAELDEDEIRLAVIETVAENFSDGVAAPLIFMAAGGPAAGMLYKAVNTMDSLFGYRNEKYREFGFVPAKMDDLFNWLPARLSAAFIIPAAFFCGLDGRGSVRIWARDRCCHASPNSGRPEAAFAGALGLQMGGAHTYGGVLVEKPTIGDDIRPPDNERVEKSLRLLNAATLCGVLFCLLLSGGLWLLFR